MKRDNNDVREFIEFARRDDKRSPGRWETLTLEGANKLERMLKDFDEQNEELKWIN